MYELPSLDNSIYEEIRAFKSYEITLNTMFEMAMRSEEVRKLLLLLKEKFESLSDNMLEEYEEVGYLSNDVGMEITRIENYLYTVYGITSECYAYFLHTQLLDDYDIETIDDEEMCLVNASFEEITEKELNQKIYKPCYLLTDAIIELAIQYYSKYKKRFFRIESFYDDHYTFLPLEKQKCLIRGHVKNDEGKLISLLSGEPLDDFDAHFLQTINKKYFMDALEPVNLKCARPRLFLPNRQMINLSYDTYVSQAETLQQISLSKESLEENSDLIDSISKIPEQDEKDKVPSQIRGSSETIAKYFFIYDFVKAKLYPDKITNEEYTEKRKEIYTSIEYTYHHKQIQIDTLNKEEEEDLLNLNMNGIFKDISSIDGMNLKWKTVRTHYYEIKKYIDGLEYKNLRVRNNKLTILKAS